MKGKRHKKILELIAQNPISTQGDLVEALRAEGHDVTQATVSRDIKELRLVKISRGNNTYAYDVAKSPSPVQDEGRLKRLYKEAVTHLDASENLVVIHTLPGNANSVCFLLEGQGWPELLGAVAGDDTILLVIRKKEMVEPFMKRLDKLKD